MSDLSLGLGLGLGLGIPCCFCFILPCIFGIICGILDDFLENKRARSSSSTQQINNNRQAQPVNSISNQKLPTLANSHINPLNRNPHVIASNPENHGEISRANPLNENSFQSTSHVVIQMNN